MMSTDKFKMFPRPLLEKIAAKAQEVRIEQIAYFRSRDRGKLDLARRLERELDSLLSESVDNAKEGYQK